MKHFINTLLLFFASFCTGWLAILFIGVSILQTEWGINWLRSHSPWAETGIILLLALLVAIGIEIYFYKQNKAHRTRWNWEGIIDTHPATD